MGKPRTPKSGGRLLLRLPASIHALVRGSADCAGLSVNEYCVRRLAAGGSALTLDGPWAALMSRAADAFGPALVGVVAHGSWIRGTAGPDSDIDALVVVERSTRLVRTMYDSWDASALVWQARDVDVHFVHLPDERKVPPALWCEAALEGIVVWECDGRLSRALLRVRHDVAAGRIVRKTAQGVGADPRARYVIRSRELGRCGAGIAGGRRARPEEPVANARRRAAAHS